MKNISVSKLQTTVDQIKGKKICIIGDLMVDEYWVGDVSRISPEAPVPVVEVTERELRLGGAANVALNVRSLGATPLLMGVIGDDSMGERMRQLLSAKGLSDDGLQVAPKRLTTRKTRILAENQHITRVDHENNHPISGEQIDGLCAYFEEIIHTIDAVIFQDYNKGVLTPELIERLIDKANKNNKIITVDPKKENFFAFPNVTLFKPNLKEAETAMGLSLKEDRDLEETGRKMLDRLKCQSLLITRGSSGMTLFSDGVHHVPTFARKVSEVSGAGDTVISTLTCSMCAGASIKEAAVLANIAAGYVVEQVGIVPISAAVLKERISEEISD